MLNLGFSKLLVRCSSSPSTPCQERAPHATIPAWVLEMVPYEEKSTVAEGANSSPRHSPNYKRKQFLYVVPKVAGSRFEPKNCSPFLKPLWCGSIISQKSCTRGDCFPFPWLLQVGSIISGYFVASRTLDLAGAPSCNTMHTATTWHWCPPNSVCVCIKMQKISLCMQIPISMPFNAENLPSEN